MPDNQIGSRLSFFRKSIGLSQEQLAESCNIKQSAVSKYEQGRVEVPLSLMAVLIERYGLNASWMITGKGSSVLDLENGNLDVKEVITMNPKDTGRQSFSNEKAELEFYKEQNGILKKSMENMQLLIDVLRKQQDEKSS